MLNFSVISKTWWEKIDSIDIWKHIRFLKIVHCFFITWALGLEESHKVMISIDIYYFFRFQNIFLQHLLASTFVYQTVWDHINHSQIMEITVTQIMELFCNFPPQHSVFEWWVPYCLIYFVWAYKFLIKPFRKQSNEVWMKKVEKNIFRSNKMGIFNSFSFFFSNSFFTYNTNQSLQPAPFVVNGSLHTLHLIT